MPTLPDLTAFAPSADALWAMYRNARARAATARDLLRARLARGVPAVVPVPPMQLAEDLRQGAWMDVPVGWSSGTGPGAATQVTDDGTGHYAVTVAGVEDGATIRARATRAVPNGEPWASAAVANQEVRRLIDAYCRADKALEDAARTLVDCLELRDDGRGEGVVFTLEMAPKEGAR